MNSITRTILRSTFFIYLLIILTILYGCTSDFTENDEVLDNDTKLLVDQATEELNNELIELNSLNEKVKESVLLEVELPEHAKISDELLKENGNLENLEELIDNKFINGKFRYDLFKVIGHSAKFLENNGSTKIYNVEIFNYMVDSVKPEITYPGDNGLIQELKITNKMSATLSFFIGEGSLANNEIYHGTISETANVIIDENEIDLRKLLTAFPSKESRNNVELITRVTVTEFVHKKYNKREKKIKVKEFPLIKSGVSLGTEFYTETSSLKKKYLVSISSTPIQEIILRIGNKKGKTNESI